jgi:threonine dehydrogenase-like Zn-dependent dehydrogenase
LSDGLGTDVAMEDVGVPATFEIAAALIASHQVELHPFVTHHFALDEFVEAYDVFARAGKTGALKVVLTRK